MECKFTDYTPKIKERLPEQFKESTKLNTFLEAFIDTELQEAQCELITLRWVNTATNAQLDGIGEIVGLPRPKSTASDDGNFGFDGDDTARGFGDLLSEIEGGFLSTLNPPLVAPVDDDVYRILIKAKILRNNSDMSVDSKLEILSTAFQTKVSYFLVSNLNPMYEIGREFYPFEQELLKLFPTTLGIGATIYSTYSEDGGFGFDGDDDALGFGDFIDEANGGYLANLIG